MGAVQPSAKRVERAVRSRLALTTALTTVILGGYGGRTAFAGSCYGAAGTFLCAGAADATDVTQSLIDAPLTVTTLAGFGIDTSISGGDALRLISYAAGLTFTDTFLSPITGARSGIDAQNSYSGVLGSFGGALSITATGKVAGSGNFGIRAQNYGTDLNVSAAAASGGWTGIYALNSGTGALSITATGAVTGGSAYGISATNTRGTDLTVSAAEVTGGFSGVVASALGTGAMNLAATGVVIGKYYGFQAFSRGTDLVVSTAAVIGGNRGIEASNDGTGALSITATGQVTGTTRDGIRAHNSGTDLTVTAAAVTGGHHGIFAINSGTGTVSVTASGAVTGGTDYGGTGYGIRTITGAGKLSVITLNEGAMVSAASGRAIFNDAGNSATTVHGGAGVAGAIRLGDGSDALTFDGGSFAGVSVFDGGDDAASADGFIDTLTFRNVSGSVNGGAVVNWENVVIGTGATMSFAGSPTSSAGLAGPAGAGGVTTANGATLTTERLSLTDGGSLGMLSGAAEAFVLDGDLDIADGGRLLMEVFSENSFDTFEVLGEADFGPLSRIDFLFDLDNWIDDFMVTVLSAQRLVGYENLSFGFTGLDPLYAASVGYDALASALVLTVDRRDAVPEPGALGLLAGGLLGLFGLGRARRRRQAAPL